MSNRKVANKGLTDEEKKEIIGDFMEWSDGLAPSECDDSEIAKYVEYGCPADICGSAVLEFLESFGEGDCPNPKNGK